MTDLLVQPMNTTELIHMKYDGYSSVLREFLNDNSGKLYVVSNPDISPQMIKDDIEQYKQYVEYRTLLAQIMTREVEWTFETLEQMHKLTKYNLGGPFMKHLNINETCEDKVFRQKLTSNVKTIEGVKQPQLVGNFYFWICAYTFSTTGGYMVVIKNPYERFKYCCQSGYVKTAQYLIDQHSTIDPKKDASDLFQRVCSLGHLNVAKWMVENGHVVITSEAQQMVYLKRAVTTKNLLLVQWLCEVFSIDLHKNAPELLQHAVMSGKHEPIIEWICEHGNIKRVAYNTIIGKISTNVIERNDTPEFHRFMHIMKTKYCTDVSE